MAGKMLRDKRMLRGKYTGGLNEVQYAPKRELRPRTLKSGGFSQVQSDKSSETVTWAWGKSVDMMLLEDTSATSVASRDGKGKIGVAVNSSKTSECHSSKLSTEVASRISESVVSLASFRGKDMLHECTGVCVNANRTSFLTSVNLVATCVGKGKISDDIVIKVRLSAQRTVRGFVEYCDFCYGIAVVSIKNVRGRPVKHLILDHDMVLESSEVVAVWRCFSSGELMTVTGKLIGSSCGQVDEFIYSTCKITMDWIGSALIDFGAKFVGINCFNSEMTEVLLAQRESTPCIPSNIILGLLQHTAILSVGIKQGGDGRRESSKKKMQESSALDNFYLLGSSAMYRDFQKCVKDAVDSYGYPLAKKLQEDMYIINTCEEKFDDDIWTKLVSETEEVASKMAASVVAIASFSGNTRTFACTGVLIDLGELSPGHQRILTSASLVRCSANQAMVDEKLTIVVHLPNKRRARGHLAHHSLEYNIALVDIVESVCHPAIELSEDISVTTDMAVIAVGRLFDECRLMATKGVVTCKGSTLDCKQLKISTCKIKKAGIGGPLFDTCGNFLGTNFYGDGETHFLPVSTIVKFLKNKDGERLDAVNIPNTGENRSDVVTIANTGENRWHVPDPEWCYPQLMERFPEDSPIHD